MRWIKRFGLPIAIAAVTATAVWATALPPATNFTGAGVTEGQFKAAVTDLRGYLNGLLGADGTTATARSTLGLATVASTGRYTDLTGIPAGSSIPAGTVLPYAGTTAPTGFLLPFGQAVSRTTFASLFAAIGTTYGIGDGSTTFNLPDLRGRAAFGADAMGGIGANRLGLGVAGGVTGAAVLGAAGGQQAHTLTTAEMPAHTHTTPAVAVSGGSAGVVTSSTSSSGGVPGAGQQTSGCTSPPDPFCVTVYVPGSVSLSGTAAAGTTGSVGSGSSHNVTPPAIVLNFIIKT